MKRLLPLSLLLLFFWKSENVKAQSTYAQVFSIIQSHCAGSACHDGSVPTFNINVSADSFYHEVINRTPVNPAAGTIYNKIVIPGDVQRSFLLRKVAHGISDGLKLNQPSEGLDMPSGLPSLAKNEIELIRQWILMGAPETGNVVDTSIINTYYRTGGIDDTYSPHDAPAAGTGFQIYYGRIFLGANTRDTEFFYKVDPHLTTAIEAKQITTMMPTNDHHFQILLFQQGSASSYPWGLRSLAQGSMENDQYGIGTAAGLWNYTLPTGTAFFFAQNQMFDLDIHIQNPSIDSIYSTDLYINFYTQPNGTAQHYMLVNNVPNLNISIPEDGQPHTFTIVDQDSSQTKYWNLWKLYTHTHKYGTAFNVWLRNPDGTKGAQIYDGNYSYEDGYDVGYYRWGPHVTFRTWAGDSLFAVNPLTGLIGEATWINTAGPNPVVWGFSAYEEMMDVGFFYVQGDDLPTAVTTVPENNAEIKVFPNPVADEFVLQYSLSQEASVQIDLFDVAGNKIGNMLNNVSQPTGKYSLGIHTDQYNLAAGIYLVSINIGGKVTTQKLVITD